MVSICNFRLCIFSGTKDILEIEVPYLQGQILEEGVDERYDKYAKSNVVEDIYNHCIRAIEHSLNFGENGLPKIGSGDWNDGLSKVGNKGKGESVWLGFFLYVILKKYFRFVETEEKRKELKGMKIYQKN